MNIFKPKQIIRIGIIIILSIFSTKGAYAENFNQFAYPSNEVDDTLLYFNEYSGDITSYNLNTAESTILLTLPGGEFQLTRDQEVDFSELAGPIYFSPDNSKMLIFAPTSTPLGYTAEYPFQISGKDDDHQWWIYDFKTNQPQVLSSDFSHVGWNSDQEIVYVFQNREVAIAPISDLANFRVIDLSLNKTVDISQSIIVQDPSRYVIPLMEEFAIYDNGKKTIYPNKEYSQIIPGIDNSLIVYGESLITFLGWDSGIQDSLYGFNSISRVVIQDNDTIMVLSLDGTLTKYPVSTKSPTFININNTLIDDIFGTSSDETLGIIQGETVFLYNLIQNTIQTSIRQEEPPIDESRSSNRPAIIGVIVVVVVLIFVGGGVFLWKTRKR